MGQRAVGKPLFSFNLSQGLAKFNVFANKQRATIGERFCHDKVIALEVLDYNSNVYDLEVQEDASYVASGVVVSNCRSVAIALLPGQKTLYGTRASQDGQIDANESYGQWIKRQPAHVQDEVLGPVRGKLMRDGKVEMDKFYNDRGVFLTLVELKARDAAMFKRAGL